MKSAPRILLFSHDSYGLGHLRRTMTLAQALVETLPEAAVLVASGSPCATHFEPPPGVDLIKLPSASKDARGDYVSRSLRCDLSMLVRLRRSLLTEIQKSFAPNLLIVDHKVLGLGGELTSVLEAARRQGTRTILGLRDIIDAPEVVAREWNVPRVRHALANEYDRVCVYGSPEVFDPRLEYPLPPELGERVEFMGYVVRPEAAGSPPAVPNLEPEVLVTVGGGEDGAERVENYLDALELGPVPWRSTVVLGPLLDAGRARRIKRQARLIGNVVVHRFHSDLPSILRRSSAVVSMAGYNSVAEILLSRTPSVLCPRSFPRREQLLRAQRLQALGLVDCLPSATPLELRGAVERALGRGRNAGSLPPLDGRWQLARVACELLEVDARRLALGAAQ